MTCSVFIEVILFYRPLNFEMQKMKYLPLVRSIFELLLELGEDGMGPE
jgi:hypothetical protein